MNCEAVGLGRMPLHLWRGLAYPVPMILNFPGMPDAQ